MGWIEVRLRVVVDLGDRYVGAAHAQSVQSLDAVHERCAAMTKKTTRATRSAAGKATRQPNGRDTLHDVEQLLYRQAECLDSKRRENFIDLFTEDGTYWMPAAPEQTSYGPLTEAPTPLIRSGYRQYVGRCRCYDSKSSSVDGSIPPLGLSFAHILRVSRDVGRGHPRVWHSGRRRRGSPCTQAAPPRQARQIRRNSPTFCSWNCPCSQDSHVANGARFRALHRAARDNSSGHSILTVPVMPNAACSGSVHLKG